MPRLGHAFRTRLTGRALELPGLEWQYFIGGLMLSAFAYLVSIQAGSWPPCRRAALVISAALYGFFFFKEGFVRHDTHAALFFPAIALAVLPLSFRGRLRWLAVAVVLVAVAATLRTFNVGPDAYFNPIQSAKTFGSQLRTLADGDRRRGVLVTGRETSQEQIGLDSLTLATLTGHSVHVDPYETTVIWAHLLKWRPVPVFQSYGTYTAALDEKNAKLLASDRAPERILRQNFPARNDGKSPELESPSTFLAMLCRYEQIHATPYWQVLARTFDRCGSPRFIRSVRVGASEIVEVPKVGPSEIVFAQIHIRRTFIEGLRELFYKPLTFPTIIFDGSRSYRLTRATAANPQVLRVPSSSGFSPAFSGGLETRSLQLLNVPSPVRVEFFRIRLSPSRR